MFLANAASELGTITSLRLLMADICGGPLVAFLWGAIASVLFQSGTAVMILLIAFTQQGVLPVSAPWHTSPSSPIWRTSGTSSTRRWGNMYAKWPSGTSASRRRGGGRRKGTPGPLDACGPRLSVLYS